jgi:hypothetical protein
MYQPTAEEVASVHRLEPMERYDHFIKKAVTRGEVTVISISTSYACLEDMNDRLGICVWPHPDFAVWMQERECPHGTLLAVPLDAFLGEWLLQLHEGGMTVMVNPPPDGDALSVGPDDVRKHLLEELWFRGIVEEEHEQEVCNTV